MFFGLWFWLFLLAFYLHNLEQGTWLNPLLFFGSLLTNFFEVWLSLSWEIAVDMSLLCSSISANGLLASHCSTTLGRAALPFHACCSPAELYFILWSCLKNILRHTFPAPYSDSDFLFYIYILNHGSCLGVGISGDWLLQFYRVAREVLTEKVTFD